MRTFPRFQTQLLSGRDNSSSSAKNTNCFRPALPVPMDDVANRTDNSKKKKSKTTITTPTIAIKRKRPPGVRAAKAKADNGEQKSLVFRDIEDFDFSPEETLKIRASLLQWYDLNQRDLPWRRISSKNVKANDEEGINKAYAVWVSELMLQQTRVQTVIDYFNRWMNKWPTIHHLAQASLEEVNEMWAGLGYYRRARFLLEGAKMIVGEGGIFPKKVSALRKVPGIGEYTAGAIASIAFKEAVPVVDGNVVRVIARQKAISANPKDSKTIKEFWKLAGQLVDPSRPGDFNQALMELGATVCTPLTPNCSACPISNQCNALSLSNHHKPVSVTDYPAKVVKSKKRHDFSAVSVVEILEDQVKEDGLQSDSLFLLVKRPDKGLLAGLWEFPSVLLEEESDLSTRREAIDQFLKKSFNLDFGNSCTLVLREDVGEYVHVFSHIRLKMYIELLVVRLKVGKNILQGNEDDKTTWRYIDSKALSSMGLTSGVKKVYAMVQKFKQRFDAVPTKIRKKTASRSSSLSELSSPEH